MNPRPTTYDKEVRLEIAKRLFQHLCDAQGRAFSQDLDEDQRQEMIDDIVEALPEDDGYKLGRELDDRSNWSVDTSMIEALDHVGFIESEVMTEFVSRWVKDNQVQTPFAVGQQVRIKKEPGRFRHQAGSEGQVRLVLDHHAQVVVFVPEAGQSFDEKPALQGVYYNVEDVEPVTAPGSSAGTGA